MMDPPPIHLIPGQGLQIDPSPQPMHNEDFEEACAEWHAEYAKWMTGERPDYFDASEHPNGIEFWEWHGNPPERKYYRPWKDKDATWFQVWETVSEGTPVTPPFETRQELVEYLVAHGDYWDQQRGDRPWSRKSAEAFCNTGWAPSMAFTPATGVIESRDVAAVLGNESQG